MKDEYEEELISIMKEEGVPIEQLNEYKDYINKMIPVKKEPTENHLAGLGFNATVKDELVVKCSGSFNRMLKIKF